MKKEHRHLGVYGLIIENDRIVLINKKSGPYDGKLDLPGGSIEVGEKPIDTLKREILEEVGITIKDWELFDADSVCVDWNYHNEVISVHHIGIFYKILKYDGEVNRKIDITDQNDDSLGADYYVINNLSKSELSEIAIMEIEKLGYKKEI